MSHLATYRTTFQNTEVFLKALEKARKELGFDAIKLLTIQNRPHYQVFLKNKKVLIHFLWNKNSYQASVDLKSWSEQYSFEGLLRKLYGFYLLELIQSQKENLKLKRVLQVESSIQTTFSFLC
jgi:hypothetical protein